MEVRDKAKRIWTRIKNWKTVRDWHIWKLKLVDARLYFVSMIVGLLTGLVAVPYHYLLYYLLHVRGEFYASRPAWYWHVPLFLLFWGILVFVSWMVKKMPLIGGGGIPQTSMGASLTGILFWNWHPSSPEVFLPFRRDFRWGVRGLPCR